jgi:hypothetical protein
VPASEVEVVPESGWVVVGLPPPAATVPPQATRRRAMGASAIRGKEVMPARRAGVVPRIFPKEIATGGLRVPDRLAQIRTELPLNETANLERRVTQGFVGLLQQECCATARAARLGTDREPG